MNDTDGPTPQAFAIVDELRRAHADCDPAYCHLAALWAEDVQDILDLATGAEQ